MGEYVGQGTVGAYVPLTLPVVGKLPAPPGPPEAHSVVVGENVGHHVGIFSPSFVPPPGVVVGEGTPLPIGADVVVGGGRGGKNGSSTGGNVGSNSDGTGGGVFANIGLVVN